MSWKKHLLFVLALSIGTSSVGSTEAESLPAILPAHEEFSSLVTEDEYRAELLKSLNELPAFRFIRKKAEELGLRVWLFGGTASSFALFVKERMVAQKTGRPHFSAGASASSGDLKFLDIFSFMQDADFVVDGTKEQAEELKKVVEADEWFKYKRKDRFEKSLWDFVTLRTYNGRGIVDSADYLNQHNDILSQGMIELTANDPASLIRYARTFVNQPERVHEYTNALFTGTNRYRIGANHTQTYMSRMGKNPQILSILRYVVKASRHGLAVPEEDIEIMQRVLKDSAHELRRLNDYAKGRIENLATQIMLETSNMDRTIELLDRIGLIPVLYELGGHPKEKHTVAWFLSEALKGNLPRSLHPRDYEMKKANELNAAVDGAIIEGTLLYSGDRSHFVLNLKDPLLEDALSRAKTVWSQKNISVSQRLEQLRVIARELGEQQALAGFYLKTASATEKFDCRDHAILSHIVLSSVGIPTEIYSWRWHSWALAKLDGVDWRVDSYPGGVGGLKAGPHEKRDYSLSLWVPKAVDSKIVDQENYRRLIRALSNQGERLPYLFASSGRWDQAFSFELTPERRSEIMRLVAEGLEGDDPISMLVFWVAHGQKALRPNRAVRDGIKAALKVLRGAMQQKLSFGEKEFIEKSFQEPLPATRLTKIWLQEILNGQMNSDRSLISFARVSLPILQPGLAREEILSALAKYSQKHELPEEVSVALQKEILRLPNCLRALRRIANQMK